MKQFRKNQDKIEVVVEHTREVSVVAMEAEIQMLDTQIASFEARKAELQDDIKEIGKLK